MVKMIASDVDVQGPKLREMHRRVLMRELVCHVTHLPAKCGGEN